MKGIRERINVVDYVHYALKDNKNYSFLSMDQQGMLCCNITSQLERNFHTLASLFECITYGFKDFSQVVNATANFEMKGL